MSAVPGPSGAGPRRSRPPAPSIRTWRAASSGPRSSASTICSTRARSRRRGNAGPFGRRERPTSFSPTTCSRSCSTWRADRRPRASVYTVDTLRRGCNLRALHLDDHGAELFALVDEVGVRFLGADAHRGAQLLVADVGETMRSLELAGHRLDDGVLLVSVDHLLPRRLDHLRELGRSVVALGCEQRIGHEVGGALVELVEVELHAPMIARCPPS